jgi:hypothetical protein
MNWIYLNKNNEDQYIEMFAHGSQRSTTQLETWNYDDSNDPIVLRGIMKHKIFKRCWEDNRPFRYMDTGYFGNRANFRNPHGVKMWHRIVDNNLQHGKIISRPDDRWKQFNININPRHTGRNIVIVMPEDKPCIVYGTTAQQWLAETLATVKQHTDRPIVVRERNKNRQVREAVPFTSLLKDAHAVIVYNSIAATESVLEGVPAFVCAPSNAADPVANRDLAKIEDPWFPDLDLVRAWACHLAYGQFHNRELRDGTAARILDKTKELSYA